MQYYFDKARHLVCVPYSIPNLHVMAKNLGIKRCWFHKDHYDLPVRMFNVVLPWAQAKGLHHRCKLKLVSSKRIVRIINRKAKRK